MSKKISIRVTSEFKKALERIAEYEGISLSGLIRQTLCLNAHKKDVAIKKIIAIEQNISKDNKDTGDNERIEYLKHIAFLKDLES